MERRNVFENTSEQAPDANEGSAAVIMSRPAAASIGLQSDGEPCPKCAAMAESPGNGTPDDSSFIYALGQIEPRFPRLGVEKEFAQALGRTDVKGQTDRQALHGALTKRENRYLARQLCWVLTVQGLETYLLEPREPLDLDLLVQATEPQSNPWIHAVIGTRGPLAPPEHCNGLMIPVLTFDQIYSFDRVSLIEAIPKPEKISPKAFRPAAEELFDRILLLTDNAGGTDEHRALNYLAMRYPAIYAKAADAFADNFSLTGVEAYPSAISSIRKVIDVVFAFTNRNTDFTEWFSVRVDVTDEFPFLVTKLSPYYRR